MALGEYVSVSSQRDSERALIAKESEELRTMPAAELAELTELYRDRGLSEETARQVAEELTAHDALSAHLEVELGIDQDDLVNPWHAALSSAVAFTLGALLPLLAILLPPPEWRVPITFVAVLIALAITGSLSARIGGSPPLRASIRPGHRWSARSRRDLADRHAPRHHRRRLSADHTGGRRRADAAASALRKSGSRISST